MSSLSYEGIESLGARCANCIDDTRRVCNQTLNAIVAVQEMRTDELAKGEDVQDDDPNLDWPRHNLEQHGCTLGDKEKTELFAYVSHDRDARNHFRGIGDAVISIEES